MEKSLLLHLPHEQLVPIFSFCNVQDLLNLALTCKSFYSILKEYLWEVIEIPWKAVAHESFEKKNLECLKYTCQLHLARNAESVEQRVTPLDWRQLRINYLYILENCNVNKLTVLRIDGEVDDSILLITCEVLKNLKSLFIERCRKILSRSWSYLEKLENLRILYVRNCMIDEIVFENIFQIPNLKELRFFDQCELTIDAHKRVSLCTNLKRMVIHDPTIRPRHFSNNIFLKELTFGVYVQVDDDDFKELLSLKNLRSLSIVDCPEISNDSFSFIKDLVSLVRLDLGNNNISDSTFSYLQHLSMLNELDLSESNNLTKIGMTSICAINTLTKLGLIDCMELEDSAFEKLEDLENLESLDISYCSQLTDQGIYHISKLKKLRILNLIDVYLITDESIRFISNLVLMKDLNLERCQKLTDTSCQYLSSLKELQKLNLSFCPNISNLGLSYLGNITSITSLNIEKCARVDNDGLSHLTNLSSLQELNIGGCTQITDDGFYFISQLKMLNRLEVSFCPVTDAGINCIAKSLLSLQLIDISNCSNITNDSVNALGKLPILKQLYLKNGLHKKKEHWSELERDYSLELTF